MLRAVTEVILNFWPELIFIERSLLTLPFLPALSALPHIFSPSFSLPAVSTGRMPQTLAARPVTDAGSLKQKGEDAKSEREYKTQSTKWKKEKKEKTMNDTTDFWCQKGQGAELDYS